MQQQPLFFTYQGLNYPDGSGGAHQWAIQPDNSKPTHSQYPPQWDNNGAFHVTSGSGSYGTVQGGAGQNRMAVGPQQPPPSQPPPTSTPPNIHGDMNKTTVMQNQSGQMNFIPAARPAMNHNFVAGYSRNTTLQQPTQIRTQSRAHIVANTPPFMPAIGGAVLTPAPTQTGVIQTYTLPMYGQPRQGTPFHGGQGGGYIVQQPYSYNTHHGPFYQHVIPQAYQNMSGGGPSPQAAAQQPQVMPMPGRPAMVQPTPPVTQQPLKQEPKKRTHAIQIIDPETNEEVVLDESGSNNNNITPTRSNDSSARETPQPNADVNVINNAVAADFAARVAARAMASEPLKQTQPPPDIVQDTISSDSDSLHKHLPLVPNSEKILSTVLSTSSQEFVPMSQKQAQLSESTGIIEEIGSTVVPTEIRPTVVLNEIRATVVPTEIRPTVVPTDIRSTVMPTEIRSTVLPTEIRSTVLPTEIRSTLVPMEIRPTVVVPPEIRSTVVPTVSAETNSPAIEIQRPKEQFPALKNPVPLSGPVSQSPMRINLKKQKSNENERQQAATVPQAVQMPPPTTDTTNKKVSKPIQKEDNAPKERREKPRISPKEPSPAPSPMALVESISSQPDSTPVVMAKSTPTPPIIPKEVIKSSAAQSSVSQEEVPASTMQQNHNGEAASEAPVTSVDSNKMTKNSKNKRTGKMKSDFNRKGVEKEGSDMDAFTTEERQTPTPTIVNERPVTPASSPLLKASPSPPLAEPAPISTSVPKQPVDKIKEDMEEKEDKLVAAKNEENAKVSALAKAEEETAPIIGNARGEMPLLTLKRSYRKDQWSPINPEGKKKYEREFLYELRNDSQSMVKPENLPDVVSVLKDSSNNMRAPVAFNMSRGDLGAVVPSFLARNSQSQRGPMINKRGSQQGSKGGDLRGGGGKGGNPRIIHMSLSLNDDVKLKTVENAWKPNRLASEVEKPEDMSQLEELYKNVRGILNKLTPQKFETLMNKFMNLPINSEQRLKGVIDLIFEKAVDEPNFSKAYANMCKICSKMEVSKEENEASEKVNFRKLLITRCQTEFERNKPELLAADKRLQEIRNCADPESKKELQSQYDEEERKIRMKSVGNIRFIGELFKLKMLTPAIMFRCLDHLLQTPEEESLECLCKLLTTIGKDLESASPPSQNTKQSTPMLNPYFQRMSELAQKKDGTKVSSRVRFMLQDVIELRQHNWVPRREDNNPKTIDQITKEVQRESLETSMALNQQPPRMNRQNDRPDDRKRGNRGNNNQNEDGWTNVGHRHYNKVAFEASKMQMKPEMDLNSLSLGGSQQFQFKLGTKTPEPKPSVPFVSSNLYSALSRNDDRKPPPQPMNNRRMTPTPSIERDRDKERQRMIQSIENEGNSSRGSSAQRDRPEKQASQPPSRDSSMPRQVTPHDNKEREPDKLKEEDKVLDDKAARLAEEKLERQTNTIFDEYLAGLSSVNDVRMEIENLYPKHKLGDFVGKAVLACLEKKMGAQKSIGLLIAALMEFSLLLEDVVNQFGMVYEVADDLAIDVPKVWELQAHVIVPIFAAEKLTFCDFKAACRHVLKSQTASKLLVPVLNLLVKDKGAGFVRKVWDLSNVSLEDFLPSGANVDAFIKENSLEYLTGEPPKCERSTAVSMDLVQEKMLRKMQNNEHADKILDYVASNVGDKVNDLQFIRALITAICEACISGSNHSLAMPRFKQYEKLIQRFVDNKEDRELACLSAVHILVSRLQHPQGLLKNIFNVFFENGLISCESFLKWKVDDTEKLENKGVSVFALASFFAALEEVETDEENS